MKPPLRTKSVGTKVSEAEFALLEERARGAGLTLSEWVREALLAGPVEVETGEIVLAELLALRSLRSLMLNLSFRADKGPLTEPELGGLIERADGVKRRLDLRCDHDHRCAIRAILQGCMAEQKVHRVP